jgi:arsenate reductase-like glutaredoxin family protein
MKPVLFYEKPGCSTNAKQKVLLQKRGVHTGSTRSFSAVDEQRGAVELSSTQAVYRVVQSQCPCHQGNELDPTLLSETEALSLLYKNPILIKRPFISVDGHQMCGLIKK